MRLCHSQLLVATVTILLFGHVLTAGQELPKKIRGYTVHREKITVVSPPEGSGVAGPQVAAGKAGISDVALTGLTFELPLSFNAPEQSGKVDFLAFHDFRVNGIPVKIEEFEQPFSFRRNDVVELPSPVSVFLPTRQLIKAVWNEMRESKEDWKVEGRVFVFGRFRKFGFYHKRVIPIDIELFIKNPIRN